MEVMVETVTLSAQQLLKVVVVKAVEQAIV
jgi:hypothetical protein